MQEFDMRVLLVDREDYNNILYSVWGLKIDQETLSKAELIIDKDTGKILKSRYF